MERMGRIAVALTAALALAFSSVSGAVLWRLWRHPPRLNVEATPEGLKWEGERYAVVTANSLNVRERPTTSSRAIDQLPKGRKIIVSSEPDADGWVSIHTGEVEGFVKVEYLERV